MRQRVQSAQTDRGPSALRRDFVLPRRPGTGTGSAAGSPSGSRAGRRSSSRAAAAWRARGRPGEEAVLAALGLGGIEPADHLQRRVADDRGARLRWRSAARRTARRRASGRARRCRAARRAAGSSPRAARTCSARRARRTPAAASRPAAPSGPSSASAARRPRTAARWRAASGCRPPSPAAPTSRSCGCGPASGRSPGGPCARPRRAGDDGTRRACPPATGAPRIIVSSAGAVEQIDEFAERRERRCRRRLTPASLWSPSRAARSSACSTREITRWICARASSPSTNAKRSSRSRANSRIVQTYGCTPSCRLPVSGIGVSLPLRAGAKNATLWNGPAGRPSRSYSARVSASSLTFGLSSHSRSSPLTLKMSALALAASAPSASEWNSE